MARRWFWVGCLWASAGCANDVMSSDALAKWGDEVSCGTGHCVAGFHCEFDACVPDTTPPPPPTPGRTDPLASGRYVFVLERDAKRLVRIDSADLRVTSHAVGALPMTVGVVGGRELTVVLDGYDFVDVLDHRTAPPTSAAYATARSLSHIALAPSGEHAVLYYDWDDPRAADRQREPGNINQVSVLFVGDAATPIHDDDARLLDVAVGFLPRDVRFAQDGSRAVVIGKDTLTTLALSSGEIASLLGTAHVDVAATEIVIDTQATRGVVRYEDSARIDVVDLVSDDVTCFLADGTITDVALSVDDELFIVARDDNGSRLLRTSLASAATSCTALSGGLALGAATTLTLDPKSPFVIAFAPVLGIETLWVVNRETSEVHALALEKSVSAVAFVGDSEHALVAHLKQPGTPEWNPALESPEESVDKAYGVSWLALHTRRHRLTVSEAPFGEFTFIPTETGHGATLQAVSDPEKPQLLHVTHDEAFNDTWLDLAALPMAMGYLPTTQHAYVTQDHAWGRVTFIDAAADALRHVTGFAMENQ